MAWGTWETRAQVTSPHLGSPTPCPQPGGTWLRPYSEQAGAAWGLQGGSGSLQGWAVARLTDKCKPRRGPLNEDVFSAQPCTEEKAMQPCVQELTEQIHRLLLQVGAPPQAA